MLLTEVTKALTNK